MVHLKTPSQTVPRLQVVICSPSPRRDRAPNPRALDLSFLRVLLKKALLEAETKARVDASFIIHHHHHHHHHHQKRSQMGDTSNVTVWAG